MKIKDLNTKGDEITLEKGGEVAYIRVGNTIVDVMHGHNHSKKEPCAIITIYPYEDKEKSRVLVYDNKNIVFNR